MSNSMQRLWTILLCGPLFAATVPNRYIVELSLDPIAVHFGQGRPLRASAGLDQYRSQIRAQQAVAQATIEHAGGKVLGTIETLGNALFVQSPVGAAELAKVAGVRQVHPVRLFGLALDHALPLHHVTGAWAQVGFGNAGAGSKIALIDTGIEIAHPGFADSGFTAPPGFPLADTMADLAYTNNKVIVARSYASMFAAADPDPSIRDHVGHGTATAMAAAGVTNTGPLATITGVAPQAYIGVYKVFGTPGVNDSAPEDAILTAIEDSVNDGMDVINLSLGESVAGELNSDPFVQIVEAASSLGVIVVAAAGNSGPNPGTVWTPATAPHAIAAGASNNDRAFVGLVTTSAGGSINSVPGNGVNSFTPIGGPFVDVSTLDGTGLTCNTLPANSLTGSIALIFRGTCTFEVKLDNAQAAGALAAVVYDNVANESPILMGIGAAALPAVMIANQDGLNLQPQIAGGLTATIQFYAPAYVDPRSLAAFSSTGPNVDYSIKPDLTAVGENFYTAAETLDSGGDLFNPSGYTITQGTSFAAPLVSGAAALLKAARPGLTTDQYRSLLINSADTADSAPGTVAWVQQAGGGSFNMLSALNTTVAASPVSLSFGVAGATVNLQQTLTITNLGAATDTFQISASPRNPGAPVPRMSTTSVQLDPGASAVLVAVFNADGLGPGQYDGLIGIQSVNSGALANVPYWFGVPSGQAAYVTVLDQTSTAAAGSSVQGAVFFSVTDAAGLPVTTAVPSIKAISSGASVLGMEPLGSAYPNDYEGSVRLSTKAGANVFQIQAGAASITITITGQ